MTAEARWTVREVLQWTRDRFSKEGLGSARLDAEVLLAYALSCDRVGLYLDLDRPLDPSERGRYRELVARRLQREPVAYLVGEKEFWSRSFLVDARVLTPRPETELLVEQSLHALRDFRAPRVLDVGTGSGIVAVTLAAERPDALVVATDISADALAVARQNADRHEVTIEFREGDLLDGLGDQPAFRLIAANLPYVAHAERDSLEPELLREPAGALFAEADGLALLTRLIRTAPPRLEPGGLLLLEVGQGQADAVSALLREAGFSDDVAVHRDLAGIERVVSARLPLGRSERGRSEGA